jgi:hypothetical protein
VSRTVQTTADGLRRPYLSKSFPPRLLKFKSSRSSPHDIPIPEITTRNNSEGERERNAKNPLNYYLHFCTHAKGIC